MKPRLGFIMCNGLPASGKDFWARDFMKQHAGALKRVNKDDIRAMLDFGEWSRENEETVLSVRDTLIEHLFDKGFSVISTDTNLSPKHEARFRELSKKHDAVFSVQDFTYVPLETCIERDKQRAASVGASVIRKMYRQYLQPKVEKPKWVDGLPPAILFDIDGTLALFGDRNPYERDFINDEVNEPVAQALASAAYDGAKIILVSGRKNRFLQETKDWLEKNNIHYDAGFMPRADDDNRKDVVIKSEIYEREIKGKYNVLYVFDDRDQVVAYWRSLGLACFQVNYGEF